MVTDAETVDGSSVDAVRDLASDAAILRADAAGTVRETLR